MQVNGPDQIVSKSDKAVNTGINMWIRSQHSCLMIYFCYQENFVKTVGKVNLCALLCTSCEREVCYHFQLLVSSDDWIVC